MTSNEQPYLIRLTERLNRGLNHFTDERRQRHRNFILSHQMPDGGIRGREGDSDLYYTSFGVRCLTMLGAMDESVTASLTNYLKQHDWRSRNTIDLMNWLATAVAIQVAGGENLLADAEDRWDDEVAAKLEQVRTSDGGYAKSTEGASGSMYHTFLVMLTYQLIGRMPPRPNALIQFVYDRQRDDGGFVEIGPMRRSGTNPTAAAAAILQEHEAVDNEVRSDLKGFLREVASDEGGFQANSRVPFADSLSTFTTVLTAQDIGLTGIYDRNRIEEWVESQLEFPNGGFRAATWDENADVEYTFYGLGLLSLLQNDLAPGDSPGAN